MILKEDLWVAVLEQHGHSPELRYSPEHGRYMLNALAFIGTAANPNCNGPRCLTCGVVWCWHCVKDFETIQQCTGARKNV